MTVLRPIVTGSFWMGLGAALLAAGCAGKPMTSLSGSQQVPPVTTNASGVTDISARPSKCPAAVSGGATCPTLHGNVWTSNVAATGAHIHQGAVGQNGPVIVPLVKTSENVWAVPYGSTITEDQYLAYWGGLLYVNVHTDQNKGGEIRAQLKP
jgi:CHRD domain